MNPRSVLEARNLYRFFRSGEDETLALRGVSLTVEAAEIVAVTGPSGSGKSTLLACLAGLDEPAGGSVSIVGRRITGLPEPARAAVRSEHIGILFQSENLFPHLTIGQNVALVCRLAGRSSTAVRAHLGAVDLADKADMHPSQLSGGELARAGLAVAVANGPDILLADEPTGELDASTGSRLLQLIRQHADQGCAVLLVTHNPVVVAAADRVVHLVDGQVHQDGRDTRS